MFDAFAAIDGGGSGRDAKDDKRVDRDEWLKSCTELDKYGFVAFEGLNETSKRGATIIFNTIDDK